MLTVLRERQQADSKTGHPSLLLIVLLVVRRTRLMLQFIQQFVTDEMLECIVQQTILYAQQYMDNTDLPPHSRVYGWKRAPHDLAELKKFLAMTITMGLVNYGGLLVHKLAICNTSILLGQLVSTPHTHNTHTQK